MSARGGHDSCNSVPSSLRACVCQTRHQRLSQLSRSYSNIFKILNTFHLSCRHSTANLRAPNQELAMKTLCLARSGRPNQPIDQPAKKSHRTKDTSTMTLHATWRASVSLPPSFVYSGSLKSQAVWGLKLSTIVALKPAATMAASCQKTQRTNTIAANTIPQRISYSPPAVSTMKCDVKSVEEVL